MGKISIAADPMNKVKAEMRIQELKLSTLVSLWFCCLILATGVGCDPATTDGPQRPASPTGEAMAGTVQLQVDFSSDKKNVDVKVPCSTGSTVFQILQRAKNMGDLEFDSQGSGGTAFVHAIDGVINSGRRGKNWVFRVNKQLAKESCGSLAVVPGDVVEWKFGGYEPELDSEPESE